MVAEFLKKMSAHYEGEINQYRDELSHLETELIENEKFMKLLESETEKVFRDFTPREIDSRDRQKIKELQAKQDGLTERKARLDGQLADAEATHKEIRAAMQEVRELEMAAEDSRWYEENVYNAGGEDEEPAPEKLSDATAAKLETILSFLLADPMRAKRELESLLK